MEKEIEEILENFNKLFGMKIEPEITTIDFTIEECKQILDYITNLQQKYEEADYDRHKLFEEKDKEINKLTAESTEWESKYYNLQQIEAEHKKINGELQQENERLKAQLRGCDELIDNDTLMIDMYKSRIDKAVEYIEDMPYLQETDEEFEDIDGNIYHTWKEWTADVLLNILQNGSEE